MTCQTSPLSLHLQSPAAVTKCQPWQRMVSTRMATNDGAKAGSGTGVLTSRASAIAVRENNKLTFSCTISHDLEFTNSVSVSASTPIFPALVIRAKTCCNRLNCQSSPHSAPGPQRYKHKQVASLSCMAGLSLKQAVYTPACIDAYQPALLSHVHNGSHVHDGPASNMPPHVMLCSCCAALPAPSRMHAQTALAANRVSIVFQTS